MDSVIMSGGETSVSPVERKISGVFLLNIKGMSAQTPTLRVHHDIRHTRALTTTSGIPGPSPPPHLIRHTWALPTSPCQIKAGFEPGLGKVCARVSCCLIWNLQWIGLLINVTVALAQHDTFLYGPSDTGCSRCCHV